MATGNSKITRDQLEAIIRNVPYAQHLGAQLESFEEGRVSLSLALERHMQQNRGFAHGGVIAFVADSALIWAAASAAGSVLTSEFKINFVAPAVGDVLFATGTVLKVGKSQVVAQAEVHVRQDATSKLVAVALGTLSRVALA